MPSLSANALGALCMSLSMLAFACNDALMKSALERLPFGEGILVRGLLATALTALIAWRTGALSYRPSRSEMAALLVRSVAETFGTICFMLAIANVPLASASAVIQASPLAVTLAAALFLGEPVGWRRWMAIAAGFAGMVVMLQPGADTFEPAALFAVGSVVAIVVRDIATNLLPRHVPALYAATQTAAIITLFGGFLVPFEGFVPPTPGEWGAYVGAGVTVAIGYVLGVNSARIGDISAVSPFRYTVLLYAVVLGYVFFAEVPQRTTFIGGAIVIAAGLYTLWREAHVARSRRPAAATPVRDFAPE